MLETCSDNDHTGIQTPCLIGLGLLSHVEKVGVTVDGNVAGV